MTAPQPSTSATIGGAPSGSTAATELTRISILSGNRQIDVGVPSEASIAALLPELARLLLRNEFGEAAEVPEDLTEQWTLSRIGERPLADNLSLSSAGVRDGDLLVLRTTATTELPVIYDDVIAAIAGINAREFGSWTPRSARWVGAIGIALAVLAAVIAVLVAQPDPYCWAVLGVAAVSAVGMLVAAVVVARRLHDSTVAALLSTCSAALGFATGWLAIGPGHLALACFLGFAAAAMLTVTSLRVTAGDPLAHMALTAATTLAAAGCLLQTLWDSDLPKTTAIVTVVALFCSFAGPRLTILLARLPIPTVPSAGDPLTDDEGDPAVSVDPGVTAIAELAMPQSKALELRAKAANSYLAGLVLGCSVVTVVAAALTAFPWHGAQWQPILLALLAGAAIASRGRLHRDLAAAASMIGAGLAGQIALGVVVILAGGMWTLIGLLGLLVVGAFACYAGVVAAQREFTPPMRRTGEIVEYLMITACIPLAAGIAGLYGLARGI